MRDGRQDQEEQDLANCPAMAFSGVPLFKELKSRYSFRALADLRPVVLVVVTFTHHSHSHHLQFVLDEIEMLRLVPLPGSDLRHRQSGPTLVSLLKLVPLP